MFVHKTKKLLSCRIRYHISISKQSTLIRQLLTELPDLGQKREKASLWSKGLNIVNSNKGFCLIQDFEAGFL